MPGSRTAGGAQHQEVVGVGPELPETGGGQLGAAADLGWVRPRELAAVALLGDRQVELGLERGQVLGDARRLLSRRLLVPVLAIYAVSDQPPWVQNCDDDDTPVAQHGPHVAGVN